MSHTCHAHGCKTPVPPRMFMCRPHWRALRPALQRAIWREYREGQEVDKQPSFRYLAIQQLAIAELTVSDWNVLMYLSSAHAWRDRALAAGKGDPFEGLSTQHLWKRIHMAKKSKKASKVKAVAKASKATKVKAPPAKGVKASAKVQRVCGVCGQPGHNARTCKKRK